MGNDKGLYATMNRWRIDPSSCFDTCWVDKMVVWWKTSFVFLVSSTFASSSKNFVYVLIDGSNLFADSSHSTT